MTATPLPFDVFKALPADECHARIRAARAKLGKSAVLLCHHYQRADIHQYADLTGDSLRLSRLAAQTEADTLVFCGVHFMAEVADILSQPQQTAILPNAAAGCSMADMANRAKVERCWRELSSVLAADEIITPITYINSSADLKAFCGAHGGIVCTSSNAAEIARWALARREKILFFPDQHLGRWTGHGLGIALDDMPVWDPDRELGGLSPEEIRRARILLWKGHCSVHQMFQPAHIEDFRRRHPQGRVAAHPECSFEVCRAADEVGSTDFLIKIVRDSAPGTHWLIGTEYTLVQRLGEEAKAQGKIVEFMSPTVSLCSTMQRIDPPHLAWALENLAAGHVVNPVRVPENDAASARLALERMLSVS